MPTPEPATLTTARLRLRPWRPDEAATVRALWEQRDSRVPPHRRIDSEGEPSVERLASRMAEPSSNPLGPLAVEERATGQAVGYCGLVTSDRTPAGEPELALELLRRVHGRGYDTEAGQAVLEWAATQGFTAVGATVWDWNLAARRVLAKLGFVETGTSWPDPERGSTLLTMRRL